MSVVGQTSIKLLISFRLSGKHICTHASAKFQPSRSSSSSKYMHQKSWSIEPHVYLFFFLFGISGNYDWVWIPAESEQCLSFLVFQTSSSACSNRYSVNGIAESKFLFFSGLFDILEGTFGILECLFGIVDGLLWYFQGRTCDILDGLFGTLEVVFGSCR